MSGGSPAVFLDRDGVLNAVRMVDGRPHPPQDVAELTVIDGVLPALEELRRCGYVLVVVTNQPDIARGTTTREAVDAINLAIRDALPPIDAVYLCPHDDADDCDCRKPKPGMIREAVREHNLDLARSVLVGDRWRDIELGTAVGLPTVFVDYGYDEKRPERYDKRVRHIKDAVEWICNSATK